MLLPTSHKSLQANLQRPFAWLTNKLKPKLIPLTPMFYYMWKLWSFHVWIWSQNYPASESSYESKMSSTVIRHNLHWPQIKNHAATLNYTTHNYIHVYLSLYEICHQAKITGSFAPKILSNNTKRYFWINEPNFWRFRKTPSFIHGTVTC